MWLCVRRGRALCWSGGRGLGPWPTCSVDWSVVWLRDLVFDDCFLL